MKSFLAKQKIRVFSGQAFISIAVSAANFVMLLNLTFNNIITPLVGLALFSVIGFSMWLVGYTYYRSGVWAQENRLQSQELNPFLTSMDRKVDEMEAKVSYLVTVFNRRDKGHGYIVGKARR